MRSLFFCSFLLLSVFGACGYSKQQLADFDREIKRFNVKKGLHLSKSESGLYSKVISAGNGKEIHLGDSIGVTYVGTLLSGKKFDEQKQVIYLPVRGLISGWKEAVIGQKLGLQLQMIVPPQLGYGVSGKNKVPRNTCMYFELSVRDVK